MLSALGTLTQTAPAPAATAMSSEQQGSWSDPDRRHDLVRRGVDPERRWGRLCSRPKQHPASSRSPPAAEPTGIVAASELSRGSIRKTLLSNIRAIQSAPLPAAASPQLPGISVQAFFDAMGMRATTVFVAGSIRVKIGTVSLVAQTAPSPTARAPEFGGIGILATTVPIARARGTPGCRAVRHDYTGDGNCQCHQRCDANAPRCLHASSVVAGLRLTQRSKHPPELVPSGITLGSAQVEGKP